VVLKKPSQPSWNVLKVILAKQRIILDKSDKMDDEGTNALMSDYIREQEKLVGCIVLSWEKINYLFLKESQSAGYPYPV
jgi:hypothetical protein